MTSTPRLVVATDGSALGNPGPGGWAWAVAAPGGGTPVVWGAGALTHTTNNLAELTALEEALAAVPGHVPVLVLTDSTYVRDMATKWRFGWRRRGWVTASGSPVKNREIIERLDAVLDVRDVTFEWVKAHQAAGRGNPLNEFVDEAAQAAARSIRSGTSPRTGPGWPTP